MTKSRNNRRTRKTPRSVMKSLSKTTERALPMVDNGLKTVGLATKDVVVSSIPIVEKGVSAVYGTMATGFDLGVKGVNKLGKSVKNIRNSKRNLQGGRRTKRSSRKRSSRKRSRR